MRKKTSPAAEQKRKGQVPYAVRVRIIQTVMRGATHADAAVAFGVSTAVVQKFLGLFRSGGWRRCAPGARRWDGDEAKEGCREGHGEGGGGCADVSVRVRSTGRSLADRESLVGHAAHSRRAGSFRGARRAGVDSAADSSRRGTARIRAGARGAAGQTTPSLRAYGAEPAVAERHHFDRPQRRGRRPRRRPTLQRFRGNVDFAREVAPPHATLALHRDPRGDPLSQRRREPETWTSSP